MTGVAVTAPPAQDSSDAEKVLVPTRYPGRWAVAVVLLAIVVYAIYAAATNERFRWDVVGQYMFAAPVLAGLAKTIGLTIAAMLMGITLGTVIAVCRLSGNPILSTAAWAFSWLFRGVPVMVQLLFWFFLAAVIPTIALGVPFAQPFLVLDTNALITPLTAALLGLGLNEAAYMSEIVRSGIRAVPEGQTEAAKSIGMNRIQTMTRVILPQAMRVIIPPTGNETIGMLKYTSLVMVVGYSDLLNSVSVIYARNFQTIPLLIVAALWYLILTAILSVGQFYLERHFERGFRRTAAKPSDAAQTTPELDIIPRKR